MQRRQDRHKRGPVFRFMRGFVNFFRSYRKWSKQLLYQWAWSCCLKASKACL